MARHADAPRVAAVQIREVRNDLITKASEVESMKKVTFSKVKLAMASDEFGKYKNSHNDNASNRVQRFWPTM